MAGMAPLSLSGKESSMKPVRIYEQADLHSTGEPIYSWILEAPYRLRTWLKTFGWKWTSGPEGGCYTSNSPTTALSFASRLGLKIGSNGTHEVHGVPMSRAAAASSGEESLSPYTL
jgi:hypothetical protein